MTEDEIPKHKFHVETHLWCCCRAFSSVRRTAMHKKKQTPNEPKKKKIDMKFKQNKTERKKKKIMWATILLFTPSSIRLRP